MNNFTDVLKNFTALSAALYGITPVLALLLRYIVAAVHWANSILVVLAGLTFGMLGAILTLTMESHPWQFVVLQGLTCGVAVIAVERIMRSLGGKIPGLPVDNQFVKDEAKP